jgi:hypothetical protein
MKRRQFRYNCNQVDWYGLKLSLHIGAAAAQKK